MSRTLIKKAEVVRRTALSETTIRRLISKSEFPKPFQLTEAGSVAWCQDEVNAWIESRPIVTPETQRRVAPGTAKRGRISSTKSETSSANIKKEAHHESN